jgi:hypothetical protein
MISDAFSDVVEWLVALTGHEATVEPHKNSRIFYAPPFLPEASWAK